MSRLFDAYIMVDWSAAAKPVTGANSIWVGILAKDARLKLQFRAVNLPTRLKARDFIRDMAEKLARRGDKVLIGFDFSFSFPAGTAAAMGLKLDEDQPWRALYSYLAGKVRERDDNSNARFAIAAGMNYAISKGPFPFWGAPARDQASTLPGKRPEFGPDALLPEYRRCELAMKSAKTGQPKSCWQLAYAGSVGSQTLLGIPHVDWLASQIDGAAIWPFQTGLVPLTDELLETHPVILVETYPSLVEARPGPGQVLDEVQVEAIARHYSDLDVKGALGPLFGGPEGLSDTEKTQIATEEGWILGA